MSHQKLLTKLEGFRSRNSINHYYINKDVYRLLYDRDFYYIAYNSIKSNDGAETAGSDGTSLHGFCEEWIDELISSFRDESYQPQPNRITYIPKKNGKMRKLSFPNGKDKLVQECVRIILECIYEPTDGYDRKRCLHKFRCPFAQRKGDNPCSRKDQCSKSPYGRVFYIKSEDDIRLFGPIPYKSELWKKIYKDRSCTERINTRILNDYGMKDCTMHGRKRNFFTLIMIGINIHLDAFNKINEI